MIGPGRSRSTEQVKWSAVVKLQKLQWLVDIAAETQKGQQSSTNGVLLGCFCLSYILDMLTRKPSFLQSRIFTSKSHL